MTYSCNDSSVSMRGEHSPYLGVFTTGSGGDPPVVCLEMSRRSKKEKLPNQLRFILGRSVKAQRDVRYLKLGTATARNEQLAKAVGCSVSQIERIISGELGTSVDYIEALAKALDVEPHELLMPGAQELRIGEPRGATARELHPDAAGGRAVRRPT